MFITGLFQSLAALICKVCCCSGVIPGGGSVWTSQQHLTVEGAGEAQADLGTKELLLQDETFLCGSQTIFPFICKWHLVTALWQHMETV